MLSHFRVSLPSAVVALLATSASAGDTKCRALVLSGGGSNGAWEAGVIWGLTHYGDPTDFYWDVHSGVSAGSVNTMGQVGFLPSQTVEAAEYLSNQAASLTNEIIFHEWVGHGKIGWAESCLTNISCYDSDPMLQWMTDSLKDFDSIKRRFTVAAADVNTGEYVTFNQTNIAFDELPMAAMSSSSIPGIFQPRQFKGHLLMDGGTIWGTNPFSAVEQCMELVEDPEDVIVDICICSGEISPDQTSAVSKNSLRNFMRGADIHKSYASGHSITQAMSTYPDVDWRYLFLQEHSVDDLDFRNSTTWPMQEEGRQNAKDALDARSKGFDGFKLLSDWEDDVDDVQSKYDLFVDYYQAVLHAILGK